MGATGRNVQPVLPSSESSSAGVEVARLALALRAGAVVSAEVVNNVVRDGALLTPYVRTLLGWRAGRAGLPAARRSFCPPLRAAWRRSSAPPGADVSDGEFGNEADAEERQHMEPKLATRSPPPCGGEQRRRGSVSFVRARQVRRCSRE